MEENKDSPYKLLNVSNLHKAFTDYFLETRQTEGEIIAVNETFIASLWLGDATITVFKKDNPLRVSANQPTNRFIKSINDIKFDPFIKNLLSVCFDSGEIKFVKVPDNCYEEKVVDNYFSVYKGHTKKAVQLQYHPSSAEVCASYSVEKQINIFNMEKMETYTQIKVKDCKDQFQCLNWNYDGSLIASSAKNKITYIFDPRTGEIVCQNKAHLSTRPQKINFVDTNYYVTTGFGDANQKEIKLFDIRKNGENGETYNPISTRELDQSVGNMFPYYDYETKVFIVPSRGEKPVHMFIYNEGQIKFIKTLQLSQPYNFFGICPKLYCEFNRNEMFRLYGYKDKKLEMESFYIPRKESKFDQNLYPPTLCGESAVSGDDWFHGQNVEPLKKNIWDVIPYIKVDVK